MCGCRNKSSYTPSAMGVARSFPSADETGTLALSSKPDCSDPYDGPFRGMTLLLAGFGTESERLFMRKQRSEAIRYARDNKVTLDPVPAGELCSEAVVELLGS